MKYESAIDQIGGTPHLRLSRLFPDARDVWIKLERFNPGGSIKDRIALSMVEAAEQSGELTGQSVIVEPTSGNTGIGLALIGAVKGYRVILVMPESLSVERRRLMYAYGAEVVLTPKEEGMNGSIDRARHIVETTPKAWMPMQFQNEANPNAHRRRTAREIIADFPDGFDYLVTGVGTGGHITGTADILRTEFPGIRIVAVEPEDSPVLSGGSPGSHGIQGIGAGFIPDVLNQSLIDEVIPVATEDAYRFTRRMAETEGMLVGISTGASLSAVNRILEREGTSCRILTFNYDSGERYLSVDGLFGQSG